MSGGNWMQTLITLVGGRDLLGGQDAHSPFLSCESLLNADPGGDRDRALRLRYRQDASLICFSISGRASIEVGESGQ